MRKQLPIFAILIGTAQALASPAITGTPVDRSMGIWRNPQDSVHVRSDHCGASMCGTVIWANDKARMDARKGGTADIIGLQLFRNFHKNSRGEWRGEVYVPDIDRTFSGTIKVIDDNTLTGTGCLIGRVGCRSQTWTRIE
ncbi:DUF2147 domain-containing protein [Sphingomonas abietis]|uniref:DUF2147 domain-containing protein n=1 Tax=Sphingomonas abietis TaxID=3012344 RepID=A0ABY7NS36_9SPHN|nr:DUF2147 domain-containing protein [Sphingomonas abietis]WBO24369.1 DUF2147 domain-containing protein [Sphingomonas abietis]